MPRAQWVVATLTVSLLCIGVGVLRSTEGAVPATSGVSDALPSRALGLSGHRRLVQGMEQHGGAPGTGQGLRGTKHAPMRNSRPLRLRIPSLGTDLPVVAGSRRGEDAVGWDTSGPAPGAAGTAVITGNGLPLAELRRGRTIEVARADHRTAVFTVERVSPDGASGGRGGPGGGAERPGRARLRLVSGETAVLARLSGPLRGR
ncbi:class F sortase [Streptomyces sp. NPDC087917]|uniref:class F sortase n=1 Tax=unclassified Streptomyces TaxID=2593676 RepID=UPI003448684F